MIVSNGALVRTQDGKTHVRNLLAARNRAQSSAVSRCRGARAPASSSIARAKISSCWNRSKPTIPIRQAYYDRNKEFLGCAKPLESCLTEDPLQVMLSGKVQPMRDAEATLRDAPFSDEYRSRRRPFMRAAISAMIDVLHPECSKGAALAEWAAMRGYDRGEVMAVGDNHNDMEMLSYRGNSDRDGQRRRRS